MALTKEEARKGAQSLTEKFMQPAPADISGFKAVKNRIFIAEQGQLSLERLREFREHVAQLLGHPVEGQDFSVIHTGRRAHLIDTEYN